MARPDPTTKAGIEERKALWAKKREEAAAAKEVIHTRVKALADNALVMAPTGPPSLDEVCDKLRRAFTMALDTQQTTGAVAAAMALAKIGGHVIERSAVAVGSPSDFSREDSRETMVLKLIDRYGEERAQRVMQITDQVSSALRGDHDPLAIDRVDEGDTNA
jgi:hypothetical protein